MIAKPTNKTIPLAILLILIVALLGWLFNGDHSGANPSKKEAKDNTATTSGARHRKPTPRGKRNNLRPANIDVRKRLDALYVQYPELAIPVKDPEKSLVGLYEDLFPSEDKTLNVALESFDTLLKKFLWDEVDKQTARDFLSKEKERLERIMANTDHSYHFQNSNGMVGFQSYLLPAFHLLTTSSALQVKLGNMDQAERMYRATNQIIKLTQNGCLIDLTASLVFHRKLNDNLLASSEELPERLSNLLLENSNSAADFQEIVKGEFAGTLGLIYRFSDYNDRGEIVIEVSSKFPELLLDELEEAVAASFLERIHQIQKYEKFSGDIDRFIADLNTPPATATSDASEAFQDVFFDDYGVYYDAIKKFNYITQTQQTAIKIAFAQSQGETFTGDLPRHYKTGEPIVWDQENNILRTGIEAEKNQDHSTIKIPTISPPEE
jgi:hypothetical protein